MFEVSSHLATSTLTNDRRFQLAKDEKKQRSFSVEFSSSYVHMQIPVPINRKKFLKNKSKNSRKIRRFQRTTRWSSSFSNTVLKWLCKIVRLVSLRSSTHSINGRNLVSQASPIPWTTKHKCWTGSLSPNLISLKNISGKPRFNVRLSYWKTTFENSTFRRFSLTEKFDHSPKSPSADWIVIKTGLWKINTSFPPFIWCFLCHVWFRHVST